MKDLKGYGPEAVRVIYHDRDGKTYPAVIESTYQHKVSLGDADGKIDDAKNPPKFYPVADLRIDFGKGHVAGIKGVRPIEKRHKVEDCPYYEIIPEKKAEK